MKISLLEYATVVSVLGCCYAMPLSRHKRLLPDVTNTASFDPLAPCSGHHRSARMALPSESWQVVTTEEETTLSELEDIEEALKDGKETLAALLRYLRRHRYNRRRIRRMRRKLLCPRTKQTEDETRKRRRAPCLPRLPKAAHVEEEARDDDRAIEVSFRRLAATAQVVDLVRRDEERYARVVRSTVLRRLKVIEVDGHFGLQGLLCKLQRLRAPERRRHGGRPSDVTWRTFARLGRTRPLRFARDYLIDGKQKGDSTAKIPSQQFGKEYLFVFPKLGDALAGPPVYVININDPMIYKVCPFIPGGIRVGSVYWTAVTYGAVTVMQARKLELRPRPGPDRECLAQARPGPQVSGPGPAHTRGPKMGKPAARKPAAR
ncbi:hypothetical protein LSAT2_002870 [Lamellibrachia satsuma]|nr:hypothetical protein LSAT2_002870 [Lamellibrachia satsuma]